MGMQWPTMRSKKKKTHKENLKYNEDEGAALGTPLHK